MAYRYRSRRATKRLARKSKRNFAITLVLVAILIYATIQWILPSLIFGLGFVSSIVKPAKIVAPLENPSLAPPVLNIPYEATNSSSLNIQGYASPNTKVRLYINDQLKQQTVSSSDGLFFIEDVLLSFGTNNIYGKTVYEKGLESLPSKTIRLIYDNEKPLLEVFEPQDGKSIQGERKLKISGKTESQAQVFINESRIIVNSEGVFNFDYQLNDGENIFSIKSMDQASNTTEIIRRVTFQP